VSHEYAQGASESAFNQQVIFPLKGRFFLSGFDFFFAGEKIIHKELCQTIILKSFLQEGHKQLIFPNSKFTLAVAAAAVLIIRYSDFGPYLGVNFGS